MSIIIHTCQSTPLCSCWRSIWPRRTTSPRSVTAGVNSSWPLPSPHRPPLWVPPLWAPPLPAPRSVVGHRPAEKLTNLPPLLMPVRFPSQRSPLPLLPMMSKSSRPTQRLVGSPIHHPRSWRGDMSSHPGRQRAGPRVLQRAASVAFSAATAATAAASAAISGGSDLTASPVKPNKGPGGGDGASSAAAAIRGGFALASDIAAGLLFPGLLVAGAGAYGGVSGAGWGSYSGQGEWRGEWQGEWAALNANLLSWGELAVPCSIAPSPHPSPPFTTPPSHPFS